MSRARILAFAQLLRIPNVFTAFADITLGACVALAIIPGWPPAAFWGKAALLCLASGCVYLAGMVWNDVFDVAEDAKARPFRPLPSRRVSKREALVLATVLLTLGLALAGLAGLVGSADWDSDPFAVAIGLAIAVLLYDGWLKRFPIGPLGMASCRFLNVLLGLTLLNSPPPVPLDSSLTLYIVIPRVRRIWELSLPMPFDVFLALVVGLYILGVTLFARTEEGTSRKWKLVLAACLMGFALYLALLLRSKLHESTGAAKHLSTLGTVAFPYLLVAFGFFIGLPIARAIADPSPRPVQSAVKRCVLGLVALDAVLATMFVGLPGLLILLLLPPALVLGKWVYST